MSDELTQRGQKLFNDNPALHDPKWLPHGLWPELDELHDRHVELIDKRKAATYEAGGLRKKFEEEDETRANALAEGTEPPQITPEAERQTMIKDASLRAKSAHTAFINFLAEAVARIQELEKEWLADLKRRDTDADEKRQKAKELLAEAERNVWIAERSRMWLTRTAQNKPMRHVAYEQLTGTPPPRQDVSLEQLAGRTD